jgi:hypothetical protein
MRNAGLWLAAVAGAAGAAERADFDPGQEARTFLLRYAGLTGTADVATVNLYRDDARIRVATVVEGRETQAGIVVGKEWKRRLRAGWFDGSAKLEASSFQGASVARQGNRLIIRARRYAQARCYWDRGYAVVIEPDRIGQFQIVEERLSLERASSCPPSTVAGVAPANPPAATPAPSAVPAPLPRPSNLPPNIVPSGSRMPRWPSPSSAGVTAVPPALYGGALSSQPQ